MSQQIQLAPINNCDLSATSANLLPGLDFEAWIGVGRQLCRISACTNWWLGDWGNYGVKEYGDRSSIASEMAEELGIDSERIRQSMNVAASVGTRVPSLQWSHHREVMALESKDQKKWLNKAAESKWTVSQLRQAIRKDGAEYNDNEPNPQLFKGAKTADELWRYLQNQMNEQPVEQWPVDRKQAWKEKLKPLHELWERL